ncbi:hypothetical protein D3C76_140350 [compost metagenome]|uniref:response regulator n=1 Tax=Pseudomonas sp. LAM2023 TaxID=2800477 RepID=UPI000FA80C56|nr:response regulator [Pseudomonas sp. LAM2023]
MNRITDTVLVLDDEPLFLDWLEDFIESRGFKTKFVTNLPDAHIEISNNNYVALLVDLNVPSSADIDKKIEAKDPLYKEFRGLFLASEARNKGYPGSNLIIYSVHADERLAPICQRLGIDHIAKGRPHLLKAKLETIFKRARQ